MRIRRTRSEDHIILVPLDQEIERTLKQLRGERRERMAAPRENNPAPREIVEPPMQTRPKLRDIQMPVIAVNPSCIRLSDGARNYELKSIHLTMLPQFTGLTAEDALSFIREFYSTVQTFPLQGLTEDELRM